MNQSTVEHPAEVPGVDLDFRPRSYFWPLRLENHLLARVKGAERRAELRRQIDASQLGTISDVLVRTSLSETERLAIGNLHPAYMGGEYLPDLGQNEVEIARITIASVTQDVTSVLARRGKRRIYYRVVDEYEGETLSGRRTRTSTRPLTLGQLETFLNGAWSILDVLAMNFGGRKADLSKLLAFVVGIDSQFYPQLGRLYRRRIQAWATERARLVEAEEAALRG